MGAASRVADKTSHCCALRTRVSLKVIRCAQLNMPALLGMLVAGAALQNARVIRLPHQWSAKIRSGGLAVILLRAGLKIDEKAFQRAGFLVARRAALPHMPWGMPVMHSASCVLRLRRS